MNEENSLEQLLAQIKSTPLDKDLLLGLTQTEKDIVFLASELKSIPVLIPPQAQMRRKYAATEARIPLTWKHFIFSFKFGGIAAACFLIITTGSIAFSAAGSLPGEKLFSIKKTAEQLRVKFATSDIQKAYLQVQIAKKRVAEAQKVFAVEEKHSPGSELAALKELSQATELAAKKVETLSPKTIRDSEKALLASLEDVSQKEKDLVSSLAAGNENENGKEDVIALSLKNQIRISEIKQSVVAASTEETVANLSNDLSEVLISGQIPQIGNSSVTVEKTVFITDEKTVFASQNGKPLSQALLKLEAKVAVTGKKIPASAKATADGENKLMAIKITVFEESINKNEDSEEVKDETTEADDLNSSTPSSILKPLLKDEGSADQSSENPNQASGNVIFENPFPQFVP